MNSSSDADRSCRIGLRPAVWLTGRENPFDIQLSLAAQAERLGIDGVFFGDRLLSSVAHDDRTIYRSSHTDLLVTLSVLAARTTRVRIGSLVMVAPYRHPVSLAKSLASIDVLSNGRLLLGLGAGWNEQEFAAMGVRRAERASRLEETIEILRLLWSGSPSSYHGRHFAFDDIAIEPISPQVGGPPIWLGTFVPSRRRLDEVSPVLDRVLARVGQMADTWVPVPYSQFVKRSATAQVLGATWRRVARHARAAGRPTPGFAFSHWYYVIENRQDRAEAEAHLGAFFTGTWEEAVATYLIGSPETIVERIAAMTAEIDVVEWVILSMLGPNERQLELLAGKVLPLLRETPVAG